MDAAKQDVGTNSTLKTFIGTYGFFAPEMLVPDAKFKRSIDIYALGVNLYMLLETIPLLDDDKQKPDICYKYSSDDFTSPHDPQLKNLALQMLDHDPK